MVYTIIGDDFQEWTEERINERNERVVEDKDMSINMDPAIAAIFKASSAVSGKCYTFKLPPGF